MVTAIHLQVLERGRVPVEAVAHLMIASYLRRPNTWVQGHDLHALLRFHVDVGSGGLHCLVPLA